MLKDNIMRFVEHKDYVPMKAKELRFLMQIPKQDQGDFNEAFNELIQEGKLAVTKKGKIMKQESQLLTGIFEGHAKGFGFVVSEGADDVFVAEQNTGGALHKDKVTVQIVEHHSGKRTEGKILKVLQRGYSEIIGTYTKSEDFGFVVPDITKFCTDIYIPAGRDKGAVTGHKVSVLIKEYGDERHKPEGIVQEILGHADDPGVDVLSIVRSFEIPVKFPREVEDQLKTIPDAVSEAEAKGRRDLRSWQTVTIDGEDAKDLDDAISLTKEGALYVLGVHIADVTHYVTEGSPLDKEALKRGTSVYLVDRVIPMLPHQLSNGICSLNAGLDRLALSCIIKVDAQGTVVDCSIEETVICVDKRMSYTEVKNILDDNDEEAMKQNDGFLEMLQYMKELSALMRKKREARGAIDFGFPETKIILDANGAPVDIHPYDRNTATNLIEDFMLAANEIIAENYYWNELPFVYRTHEKPDREKMQKLCRLIGNFGYFVKMTEEIHPKELQKLLTKIEGKSEEAFISRMLLRSLKQARYTTNCDGHYGLAAQYYCHFTAPIRRYPDMQIHRIIKENISGKMNQDRIKHYEKILPHVSNQNSKTERRAEEAEREVEKLKKAVYMSKRIGQVYEGMISGVTGWGFYVELDNTVEGLVHINSLADDYYLYDEENYRLVGERTNQVYKIGDRVTIQVVKADLAVRTIDFEITEPDQSD